MFKKIIQENMHSRNITEKTTNKCCLAQQKIFWPRPSSFTKNTISLHFWDMTQNTPWKTVKEYLPGSTDDPTSMLKKTSPPL